MIYFRLLLVRWRSEGDHGGECPRAVGCGTDDFYTRLKYFVKDPRLTKLTSIHFSHGRTKHRCQLSPSPFYRHHRKRAATN